MKVYCGSFSQVAHRGPGGHSPHLGTVQGNDWQSEIGRDSQNAPPYVFSRFDNTLLLSEFKTPSVVLVAFEASEKRGSPSLPILPFLQYLFPPAGPC